MSGIAQQLSIATASPVSTWEALPAPQQQQIRAAIAPDTSIECIAYPETPAALAAVVAWASRDRIPFLPCGNLSKLHWGGLASGVRFVISTARMNRLIEHAIGDLTVTAEAGMQFADLQAILAQQGQFLPIDPHFPHSATLGGIVATADTRSLRQRYGGIRDLLIGVNLVRSDGQIAKAGGRVVKNVAGYDLMKLLTGSWGTLAVIEQLTLRIYPIAPASQTVILTGAAEAIAQAAQTLIGSSLTPIAADLLPPATVQAIDRAGFGLVAQFRSIEISVTEQANSLLKVGEALGLKAAIAADSDEAALWQALREQVTVSPPDDAIACKIGVLPAKAVSLLSDIQAIAPCTGAIHASSGLGMLRFTNLSIEQLGKLRRLCEASGGFLIVLAASIALKQQFDVWGDVGNSLPVMQKLKQQFDSQNLLSPGRFVGGI